MKYLVFSTCTGLEDLLFDVLEVHRAVHTLTDDEVKSIFSHSHVIT